MKNTKKKQIKLLSLVILFCFATKASQGQNSKIAGNWKRNDGQCEAGGLSINSIPIELKITTEQTSITINGTNKNGKGEITVYTNVLHWDGSQTQRPSDQNGIKYMTLTWSPDKIGFTENATFKDKDGKTVQINKQTYALSAEGQTLTVKGDRIYYDDPEVGTKTFHLSEVYTRQ